MRYSCRKPLKVFYNFSTYKNPMIIKVSGSFLQILNPYYYYYLFIYILINIYNRITLFKKSIEKFGYILFIFCFVMTIFIISLLHNNKGVWDEVCNKKRRFI